MLGQLRDRIQNAQHDLSASIRDKLLISNSAKAEVRQRILGLPATSVLSNSSPTPFTPSLNPLKPLDVPLEAGSELITLHQAQWIEIHSSRVTNGALAKELASEITEVSNHVLAVRSSSNQLLQQLLTTLPEIEAALGALEGEVAKSLTLFGALEDAISELEEEDAKRMYFQQKERSREALNSLVTRKGEELKRLESGYVARETEKLRAKAEREAEALKERQAVFQAAFEEELKRYKEKVVEVDEDVEEGYQQISEDKLEDETEEGVDVLADISLDVPEEEVDALESFLAE